MKKWFPIQKGVVAALVMMSMTSFAQQPQRKGADESAQFLMALYTQACLNNISNPQNAVAAMQKSKVQQLSAQQAAPLLGGAPGGVWAMATPYGPFFISVRQDGQCSVMAQKANPADVEKLFMVFAVPQDQRGLVVKKVADTKQNTANGVMRSMAYTWQETNNPKSALQMSMATVSGATGNVMQAVVRSQPLK